MATTNLTRHPHPFLHLSLGLQRFAGRQPFLLCTGQLIIRLLQPLPKQCDLLVSVVVRLPLLIQLVDDSVQFLVGLA